MLDMLVRTRGLERELGNILWLAGDRVVGMRGCGRGYRAMVGAHCGRCVGEKTGGRVVEEGRGGRRDARASCGGPR